MRKESIKTKNNQKRLTKDTPDIVLMILIMFITAFGVVMVYSSSHYYAMTVIGQSPTHFAQRQAIFAIIGIIAMWLITYRFDYRLLANIKVATLVYILTLIPALLLPVIGHESNGAKRWIRIGPLSIQPSELVKIGVIIMLAAYITKYRSKLKDWKYRAIGYLLILGPAAIILQENLSSAIVIGVVGMVIMFLAVPRVWTFAILPIIGAAFIKYAVWLAEVTPQGVTPSGPIGKVLKGYRLDRFRVWLDPWTDALGKGFQPIQSMYAIGSGGLFGQGLGRGMQKLGFLPEPHNDIIFAVIAEELGLVGATVLLLAYAIVVIRGLQIASKSQDLFGALVATGITTMVGIQVIINVAVNTNLIPTTGMQLPLISYGGTALVILLGALGILINISRKSNIQKPYQ